MKQCYLKNGIQLEKWGDVYYVPVIVACKQVNLRLTSLLGKNPFNVYDRNISMDERPNNERVLTTVIRLECLYKSLTELPEKYPYKCCGIEYHEWECKTAWGLR